jgi:hypothetical protein
VNHAIHKYARNQVGGLGAQEFRPVPPSQNRLTGHPKADRVYAWSHDTDDPAHPRRHVTVLHIPPVISPQTAVKAAIVQEFKEHGKAN